MSTMRFLDTISLKPTDRIAQNEWLDQPDFVMKLTGIDPYEDPAAAVVAAIRKLGLDLYIGLPHHSVKFEAGEETKALGDGRYVSRWGFTGSSWHLGHKFANEFEVLGYDPFANTTFESRRAGYQSAIDSIMSDQQMVGEACYISGLYYTMLFQWFILTFGWEMFLITAAAEPVRFEKTIEQFTKLSVEYAQYFAQSDLPVFFCHDDIALTRGLVFSPQWYRKYILPRYEEILDPIKSAGKKIMFVSDGNYTALIDDLIAVGVEALFCDQYVDIDWVLSRYGGKIAVVGNANIDILTRGTVEDVRKEVIRCMNYGKRYPGYVMHVSGDMPHNVPLENMEAYFAFCQEYGRIA